MKLDKDYNIIYIMDSNIIEAPETREEFKLYVESNKNKGIILYATSSWCKPCRKTKPFVIKLFKHMNDSSKVLMIMDIDRCSDVSRYLRIRKIPQLTYYDKGEPTYVVQGGVPSEIQYFFGKIA